MNTSELRNLWIKAKNTPVSEQDLETFKACVAQMPNMSQTGFSVVLRQMKDLELGGLPGVDCKTFSGWKTAGFRVKKGETSKISGISWMSFEKQDESGKVVDKVNYPKEYKLFHISQVEKLA